MCPLNTAATTHFLFHKPIITAATARFLHRTPPPPTMTVPTHTLPISPPTELLEPKFLEGNENGMEERYQKGGQGKY
jgi:hypothetical protein